MTVATTAVRISSTGNGVTTLFNFPYEVVDGETDLDVYVDGVLKTYTTHYTFTASAPGGDVIFGTAPANGLTVLIVRNTVTTQPNIIPTVGVQPSAIIEESLDREVLLLQENKAEIERAIRLDPTYTTAFDMLLPTDLDTGVNRRALLVNATGDGWELSDDDPDTSAASAAASAASAAASAAAADVSADAAEAALAGFVALNIATANEASDTTCFPVFVTASGTQTLPGKTNTTLTYNASTGALGSTSFVGALTSATGLPLTTGVTGILPIANGGTGLAATKPVLSRASTIVSAVATGTTTLPVDDTIPQNTEGTEFMSLAFTPVSASSTLVIEVKAILSNNTSTSLAAALFVDSTANALAANNVTQVTVGGSSTLSLKYVVASGSTSARTYKVRGGSNSAGTMTFNGSGGARLFGGVINSYINITEYLT